jgi:hypothetical protein
MDNINKALELFVDRDCEHIIHAGDFTSPFTAKAFKDYTVGFTAIFGNNDGDKAMLNKAFGNRIHNQPHVLKLQNRNIVIVHEPDSVDMLVDSGLYNLVIHGHTHEAGVRRTGKILVVNPGEVCGWVYGKPSVAIVDLNKMTAEIIALA